MVEEEHKEKEQLSEGSTEWDPIHSPHHHRYLPSWASSLQTHHRSLSDPPTQFKTWPISPTKDTNDGNRSIIFPPINHEGLHLSSPTPSPSLPNHHDNISNNNNQQVRKSPYSSENGLFCVPLQPSGTGSAGGGEVARWVGIGFELLRTRVICIASSLRNFARFGGANWPICSAARVGAAAVLVFWLYAVVRQRRRRNSRVRMESRDHLISVIKEKDEKINHLLQQIAQMNQLLLAVHRDLLPGTGGPTK